MPEQAQGQGRAGQGSHRPLTSVSQEAGSLTATSRMLLASSLS